MLIPFTLPPPVRQFVRDGLQLLVARLTALTEEFRSGLIAAIGRTVADGAEHLLDRAFPTGRSHRIQQSEYEDELPPGGSPDDAEPAAPLEPLADRDPAFESIPRAGESDDRRLPPSRLSRALVAAGLNALGVWLLRIGLVPTSTVAAMLGGMVLLFR
jgi:hypothetical protein